jgi:hypothetical protein
MNDHTEIEELLGAYALDAVEPEEAAAIEEHLDTCPRCRAELAGHREVVGLLGDGGGAAPAGLWERLSASLEEPPPPLRLVRAEGRSADPFPVGPARRPKPRAGLEVRWSTAVAAAAAAAAVIGGLGVEVARLDHRTNHLVREMQITALQATAESAASRTDARRATLRSPDGKLTLETVILPSGAGYVLPGANLPRLPADQTYQLWGLVGTDRRNLGVLGNQPQVAAFQVEGDMVGLAVTAERAPGVTSTGKAPLVVGTLRS